MSNELIPYSDIEKMGKAVAGSGLFGVKTAEQAVALMLVAQALGKHPALAAMEYNIIQGRPAKKADAMLSDFQAAGGKIEWHSLTDTKVEATFTHPQGGSAKIDWDIERAKKAGLYDKEGSMYKKYPRSMLRSRVIAEGVRTVYPAATGGVRAVEEFDDSEVSETQVDPKKSRLETIIDVQHEEASVVEHMPEPKPEPEKEKVKPEAEKKQPAKSKEAKPVQAAELAPIELKEGEKLAQGFILTPPKAGEVDKDGKPAMKYNFIMDGKKYGTFEKSIFEGICAVMDIQNSMQKDNPDSKILINLVYKDRIKGDKVFFDIVRFSQGTAKKLPI